MTFEHAQWLIQFFQNLPGQAIPAQFSSPPVTGYGYEQDQEPQYPYYDE
jgi:hypothetical protein